MVTRVAAFAVEDLRFLELHEARAHSVPGRELRDLGDAVFLHDPRDREPFWNRVSAVQWPARSGAFDRRLAETLALFASVDRIPHFWLRSLLNEPPDLASRLLAFGFEEIGGANTLVLDDPEAAFAVARAALPPDVTLERLTMLGGVERSEASAAISVVLTESFDIEPDRRAAIELETTTAFDHGYMHAVLIRVAGEPAAVAKRATFDGATYLSSIGTRPAFRGRGLGTIAAAAAAADAAMTGCRWTYLAALHGNDAAIRLYERIGFVRLGDVAPDLILR